MLSRILLDKTHLSRAIFTRIYPGRAVIGNGWFTLQVSDDCSSLHRGACSNNSHLLQRFVNLDVRHQLELQEYHHRVKMEPERESDYLRRSREREGGPEITSACQHVATCLQFIDN